MTVKVSKFKRHHEAYVLVVRDPDKPNEYTADGDVHVIDIDLGSGFNGAPGNEGQAVEWAGNLPRWLNAVPINSGVYRRVMEVVAYTVRHYPAATAVVTAYKTRRET
jgi:hypothetical protein